MRRACLVTQTWSKVKAMYERHAVRPLLPEASQGFGGRVAVRGMVWRTMRVAFVSRHILTCLSLGARHGGRYLILASFGDALSGEVVGALAAGMLRRINVEPANGNRDRCAKSGRRFALGGTARINTTSAVLPAKTTTNRGFFDFGNA